MTDGDEPVADHTVSWRELWAETWQRLGDPQEARWICQEAGGLDGTEWAVGLDQPVGERAVARLDAMVARRLAGEPLQYVLGSWPFRQLTVMVDRRVLIPRPETEEVVEVALAEAVDLTRPLVAVDLGTGSGVIGLSLARELRGAVEVWCTDASADALDVARANLAGVPGLQARRVRMAQGRWFEALPPTLLGEVGLVVSNPPYVGDDELLDPVVADWEPASALRAGPDGLRDIRQIIADATIWLRPGGVLVLEIGAGQGPAVAALARAAGLERVDVRADLVGHDRALVARRAWCR